MKPKFLNLAKKLSYSSDHHSHKLGCVVAKGNKILGTGFNLLKTSPHSPHSFKFIHAEYMAVLNARFNVKGATVYIFRQHKNGIPALSKPCPDCHRFLLEQGVAEIIYTYEGSFVKEKIA